MECRWCSGDVVGVGVGVTLEVGIHRFPEARIAVERWEKIWGYVAWEGEFENGGREPRGLIDWLGVHSIYRSYLTQKKRTR